MLLIIPIFFIYLLFTSYRTLARLVWHNKEFFAINLFIFNIKFNLRLCQYPLELRESYAQGAMLIENFCPDSATLLLELYKMIRDALDKSTNVNSTITTGSPSAR